LLAAARQNAPHSTGPRSAAAKQNSKLNALKRGAYVGLLHRFSDPMYHDAQQTDEEERQSLRKIGFDYELSARI
jgi:hypothetical protein